MEIVFRSSFLLALTCSKRICFPPDTDSFCACERMGLEHLGAGTRGSGLTSYTGGGGAGRRNAERRRPSAQRPGPLAPAAPKPAPPGCVYQPTFVSGRPGTRLQEPLLFLPPYICCKSFPVVSHKRRGAFYSPSFLRSEWKDQKSFVCVS